MVRVLNTLEKWKGKSAAKADADKLKTWIKEILDGAINTGFKNGLLKNYLDNDDWFGEVAGTALLSAVAYRMAVNDPAMFPQQYISWADAGRNAISHRQGQDGVIVPSVNPYAWFDNNTYTKGSPEAQAFAVNLYTAYRDCVSVGICQQSATKVSARADQGIGPNNIQVTLHTPITFTPAPSPTSIVCGTPAGCDNSNCQGKFSGLAKYPTCQSDALKGCRCVATSNTCGARQSCDNGGCNGAFDGLKKYPQCTGNFEGCECIATSTTCGARQSCDNGGCNGAFNGLAKYAQCTNNFVGCECIATSNTCGPRQSCDNGGCNGAFGGLQKYPKCTGNFVGCDCTATSNTCGPRQSCDNGGCNGAFDGPRKYPQCTNNFVDCDCTATSNTCGNPQSCDNGGCNGAFNGNTAFPQCTNNFVGCRCTATGNTCGAKQSCDLGGCGGTFGSDGTARCSQNFRGCECSSTQVSVRSELISRPLLSNLDQQLTCYRRLVAIPKIAISTAATGGMSEHHRMLSVRESSRVAHAIR
jgi:hypothetical protein